MSTFEDDPIEQAAVAAFDDFTGPMRFPDASEVSKESFRDFAKEFFAAGFAAGILWHSSQLLDQLENLKKENEDERRATRA